jgi:TnpA family transposase
LWLNRGRQNATLPLMTRSLILGQYGTKVISSTIRDATYVLDEILNNETDLTILEHTTDTAGYTDLGSVRK